MKCMKLTQTDGNMFREVKKSYSREVVTLQNYIISVFLFEPKLILRDINTEIFP